MKKTIPRISKPIKDSIIKRVSFKSGLSLILDHDEIIKIEKTTKKHIFGIAVDVGTTSVCVSLCNLESGEELACATRENEQAEFGLDLSSRSRFANRSQKNLRLLSEKGILSVNKALDECIGKSGADRERIFTAVLAGTPLMRHLLFAVPLYNLDDLNKTEKRPFHQIKSGALGLKINSVANVRFLPCADKMIGSDVLATILTLDLDKTKNRCLCIDLGMQAKIILARPKNITVSLVPINSVFEGHLLKCGMVTQAGAIEWVRLDKGKIKILTISHIRPMGICGSGIIDIVGELIKSGMIGKNGKMKKVSFVIYQDKKIKIELTSQDLKKISLSKASVFAAWQTLLKKMKISRKQIAKVFLAGELGEYLNAEHIIRVGLLHKDLKKKISYVGNSAFQGVKMAMLSERNFKRLIKIGKQITHIDLSKDKGYIKEFNKALSFSADTFEK